MRGIDLIKQFEGCRLTSYQDVRGKWTVGWGATGQDIDRGTSWTQAEADADLQARVDRIEHVLQAMLEVPVTDNQKAALTSLAYNIGLSALQRSTVLKKLNAGDEQGAAEAFMSWQIAAGKVVPGLVKRRAAEKAVFLTPDSQEAA